MRIKNSGKLYAYDKAYRLTSAIMGSADPSAEWADEDWDDYAYDDKIDFNMDDVSGAADKSASFAGWKSPRRQLPDSDG